MDDGRVVMAAVKRGWRWCNGDLWFSKVWEEEDSSLSPQEVTRRVIQGSLGGVHPFLSFTTEIGEEYQDGCLPTLDLNIWVGEDNQVNWKFFEKPTTTSVTVQMRSAYEENSKQKTLSNDLIRKLSNTRRQGIKGRGKNVVDQHAQKLLNSGYRIPQVRKIVVAGIKGYEGRVKRCNKEGRRL